MPETRPCRVCELEWGPDRLDDTDRCITCQDAGIDSPEEHDLRGKYDDAREREDDAASEASLYASQLADIGVIVDA